MKVMHSQSISQSVKRVLTSMLVGFSPLLLAADLADPTLPPDVSAQANGVVVGSDAPVLQSVMLGSGIKMAMINGQMVALGQKYGDAKLIRLTDQRADLRYPDGKIETLFMHAGVEKKAVLPRAKQEKTNHKKKAPTGAQLER